MAFGVTAILGAVGAATGLAGAGLSFSQAAKQKKAQQVAEAENKKLMAEASVKATKNFYEKVRVPMEAYNREFRENTAQQMQNVQSLQEAGGRTLAAGIGKVAGQGQQGNAQIREGMAQDLYQNQLLQAEAATDVNNTLIDLDVAGAADASLRARDANALSNNAMASGLSGLSAGLTQAADLVPLYLKNKTTRQLNKYKQSPQFLLDQNMNKLNQQNIDNPPVIDIPPLKALPPTPLKSVNPPLDFQTPLNQLR